MFRSLDKESKKEVLVTTFLFLTSKSPYKLATALRTTCSV